MRFNAEKVTKYTSRGFLTKLAKYAVLYPLEVIVVLTTLGLYGWATHDHVWYGVDPYGFMDAITVFKILARYFEGVIQGARRYPHTPLVP
jgi:hypothetical protein